MLSNAFSTEMHTEWGPGRAAWWVLHGSTHAEGLRFALRCRHRRYSERRVWWYRGMVVGVGGGGRTPAMEPLPHCLWL